MLEAERPGCGDSGERGTLPWQYLGSSPGGVGLRPEEVGEGKEGEEF